MAEKRQKDDYKIFFSKIKRALKVLGVYNSIHDPLISSCAQLMCIRDEAFRELRENGLCISELYPSGERTKLNPAYSSLRDTLKELRGTLNDLQMNIRNSSAPDEDAMDELTDKLNDIMNG